MMLKKDIIVTFGGQVVRVFMGIVGAAILARALGPSGRGLYALALLLPMTIGRCFDSGMIGVNSTFAGLYRDQRKSLFVQTVLFVLICSTLGVVGMAAYFFWLPVELGRFAQLPGNIVIIALLLIPVEMASVLLRELARGSEQIVATVVVVTCGFIARTLAILVFLVLLDGGLVAAMWIAVCLPLLLAICHLWQVRKFATFDLRKLSRPLMKHSVQFGGILTISSAAKLLIGSVSLYLLNYMKIPVKEIGLFSVALMLVSQIRIIPDSVAQAFLPRASNDPETRLKQTPFVFRCTLIASVSTMVVLILVGPPALLILFGWRYSASIVPFLIMIPGITLFGSSRVLGMYLWVRKKPQYTMANNWITLVLMLVVGFFLVRWIGMLGAAVTFSLGNILLGLLTVLAYRKVSGVGLRKLVPTKHEFKLIAKQAVALLRRLRRRRSAET